MKYIAIILCFVLISANSFSQTITAKEIGVKDRTGKDSVCYLSDIITTLNKKYPDNKTINLVFHGHSVPSGYFKTPDVRTMDSYPLLTLKEVKELYPYARVNVIVTAIGGENSKLGAARFESDVLIHKPDVIFIDYILNDRSIGLEESKKAYESMIRKTLEKNIKLILLTPSPDEKVDILDNNTLLAQLSNQVKELAKKYNVGLVDSYELFRQIVKQGGKLDDYMAQFNHPNEKGHKIIADGILEYFK
jgi:acyl-CoA thioesterase I